MSKGGGLDQFHAAKDSEWNKDFDLKKAPKIWWATQRSGAKTAESL